MRTKTLLLTTVLSAAAVATSVAQVYSVNAVGYVNKTVPAGEFAILANPLNQPENSLTAVLADVPNGTVVYEFDATTGSFGIYTKRSDVLWTGTGAATASLDPGEGFFIKNNDAADFTITFVGEVPQGTLSNPIPAGFSIISSIVPQAGLVQTDLGLPAQNGDVVYKFDGSAYAISTKRAGTLWTGGGGEPTVEVGEGFFFNSTAANSWDREFSINN